MNRRKFLSLLGLSSAFPWITKALAFAPESLPAEAPLPSSHVPFDHEVEWTKITLVACGGAGIAMSRHINKTRYGLHEIIAVDSSRRSLNTATNADKRILITDANHKKPRTASEAWHSAVQERHLLAAMIGEPHMIIIVGGLGGAAGTGITNAVSKMAMGRVPLTVSFVTLPYEFESNNRHTVSKAGFKALTRHCDNVCAFSQAALTSGLPEEICFGETLMTAQMALDQYLWNTAGCITRYGLVGVDFEDIRTVLAQGGGLVRNPYSTIGWGTASGHNRGEIAVNRALTHPTLHTKDPGKIVGISLSIRGATGSLKMRDINAAMGALKAELNDPDAHIIFSADFDDSLVDDLQVSLILNREAE